MTTIEVLDERTKRIEKRLDNIESDVAEIKTVVTEMNTKLDERAKANDERFASHDQRINRPSSRFWSVIAGVGIVVVGYVVKSFSVSSSRKFRQACFSGSADRAFSFRVSSIWQPRRSV